NLLVTTDNTKNGVTGCRSREDECPMRIAHEHGHSIAGAGAVQLRLTRMSLRNSGASHPDRYYKGVHGSRAAQDRGGESSPYRTHRGPWRVRAETCGDATGRRNRSRHRSSAAWVARDCSPRVQTTPS